MVGAPENIKLLYADGCHLVEPIPIAPLGAEGAGLINFGLIVWKRRIKEGKQLHKLEETVAKLRQVEVLCGQGVPRLDSIR